MTKEIQKPISQVNGGDEVRFDFQRRHRRVMVSMPMSGGMTLLIIPGFDNVLRKSETVVFVKI